MFNFDPNLGMLSGGGCLGGFGFGSSVKIKTSGTAKSIFQGGPTYSTEVTVKNEPSGGWGIALGFLNGLLNKGGCLPNLNLGNYNSTFEMLNNYNNLYSNNLGYRFDPRAAEIFGLNSMGFDVSGGGSISQSGTTDAGLSSLSTIAKSVGWNVVKDPTGTYTAVKDGESGITGTYDEVMDKLKKYSEAQPKKTEKKEEKKEEKA